MFTNTFLSFYFNFNLWQTVYDVGAGGVVVGRGARQGHLQSKCQQYFLMKFLNFQRSFKDIFMSFRLFLKIYEEDFKGQGG